ncbi:Z1 domain-containing protein [Kitasatospora purpeofusca]|uniref:Z1 domain-containing protein n=1 Tax=Kitasatospora purpeofusca TaxID=67352 RepID=UPI003F4AEEED
MARNNEALYETFRLVLELSRPADRLAQLGLPEADIEELQARHARRKDPAAVRHDAGSIHDIAQRALWYLGPTDSDTYWPALLDDFRRRGYSESSCRELDEVSTRVVAELRHPNEPSFSTRGMILTHRQAGTTTNVMTVIAKAADVGYRLFVVLASPLEMLRRQVHWRLSEQFVRPHPSSWMELTSIEQDFRARHVNPAAVFGSRNGSLLCVVKKNVRVLRDLGFWLEQAAGILHEFPALIIDMDADQSPVASSSVIAPLQGILQQLPRAAYLGYADTPLTGLLLDPEADDLFPRDFIVALPRPVRYTGPEILFGSEPPESGELGTGDDGYDMIRSIPAAELPELHPASRAAVEDFTPVLPPSLRQAVEYFWMMAAARKVRSSGIAGNTMVVHTSPLRAVQQSFLAPLQELRKRTEHLLDSPSGVARLREAWQWETGRVPAEDFSEDVVSFGELSAHLPVVLRDCRIIADGGGDGTDPAAEPSPGTAIVVAGVGWPRGLVPEGLSVGYFATTGSAYGTVQQMERWCGFRPGYEDLARIWMTEELAESWRQIAGVQTELRRQLERAEREAVSPRDLVEQLRTHPMLRGVRAAKQRQPIAEVAYGGRKVETRRFRTDAMWLSGNLEAARALVTASASAASRVTGRPEAGRYVFFDVPSDLVLDFLAEYRFLEGESEILTGQLLIDYIRKRIRVADSLRRWNVAVLGRPVGTGVDMLTFADEVTVGRVIRSRLAFATPSDEVADIKTLMGPRDAAVDLDGGTELADLPAIRQARRTQLPHTGLLALYPIDRTSAPAVKPRRRAPLNAEEHVIGVGLVFPEPAHSDSVVHWSGP